MAGTPQPNSLWWKKLGWLVLIWATSVATLGVLAWSIRLLMHAAGLVGG